MPNVEFEKDFPGEYTVRVDGVREYEIVRIRTLSKKWHWRVYQATVCIFDCGTLGEAKRYVLSLVTR